MTITADKAREAVKHRVDHAFDGRRGHRAKAVHHRNITREQLTELLALAFLDGVMAETGGERQKHYWRRGWVAACKAMREILPEKAGA